MLHQIISHVSFDSYQVPIFPLSNVPRAKMTPTGLHIALSQSDASADGSSHPRFCTVSPLEMPKEVASSRIVCFNNMIEMMAQR